MRNLFDVSGKVVLITGGSRGIGEMMARGFVENGAKVYISARKASQCDETAAALGKLGACVALPADMGVEADRERVAAAIQEREGKLDVLINNAGASWGAPIDDYPQDGWDKVFNVNLRSVFFLTQRLLPALRAAATRVSPAHVINVASVNGLSPPSNEAFAYSASKAGMLMLTRHLAKRLAEENILVNAIAPGPFYTKLMAATLDEQGDEFIARNPLHRLGEPEDIAGVAIFLASRASGYTTGAIVPCDGGVNSLAG